MTKSFGPARLTSCIMVFVCGVCVAVQYNDPDGWVWMIMYGYALGVSVLGVTGRYGVWVFFGALAYLLGAIWWMPWSHVNSQLFGMPHWHMGPDSDEEAREAAGLFIMAGWLLVMSWWWYKGRTKKILSEK